MYPTIWLILINKSISYIKQPSGLQEDVAIHSYILHGLMVVSWIEVKGQSAELECCDMYDALFLYDYFEVLSLCIEKRSKFKDQMLCLNSPDVSHALYLYGSLVVLDGRLSLTQTTSDLC